MSKDSVVYTDTPAPDTWIEDERAKADAMRHMATGRPEPESLLRYLTIDQMTALLAAYPGEHRCYRLPRDVRNGPVGDQLFSMGIVEARGPYLGTFGMRVRKALKEALDKPNA